MPILRALPLCLLLAAACAAQQVADSAFAPPIPHPAHPEGAGPIVMIDAAHYNFHTADGRYYSFAQLLRRDGFRVISNDSPFTADHLSGTDLLVISNPLHERNTREWNFPTPPAFTDDEVAAVRTWVENGGALLLIADHMPFPGAVENLAAAFGVAFSNGFAFSSDTLSPGVYTFRRPDNTLREHPITNGRTPDERIDSLVSFTGSAFQADNAHPLLVFGDSVVSLVPEVAWEFTDSTRSVPVSGWLQGAVMEVGEGRIAVFGEAAMFSAQLAGPDRSPAGMNDPAAPQNARFLLNTVRWLTGNFVMR